MMTSAHWQVLAFVVRYIDAHGYAPTCREIADGIGVSQPTASRRLIALETMGFVERGKGHRNLRVMSPPLNTLVINP